MNRYDDFDYHVEYGELEPTSDNVRVNRQPTVTGKQKRATQSWRRRGSGGPKLQNGIHRRRLNQGTR